MDKLAALTGATVFDKLVPFLTTHIVCKNETPLLRANLGKMYSSALEGTSNKTSAFQVEAVELVTIDWMLQSFLKQTQLASKAFRPPMVKLDSASNQKRLNQEYRVKKNIF